MSDLYLMLSIGTYLVACFVRVVCDYFILDIYVISNLGLRLVFCQAVQRSHPPEPDEGFAEFETLKSMVKLTAAFDTDMICLSAKTHENARAT